MKNSFEALLIIDMWDNHWCPKAVRQGNLIAPKINRIKKKYDVVIHAPSGGKMYHRYSKHKRWLSIDTDEAFNKKINIVVADFPIYSGIGSCPDGNKMEQPWHSIHPKIDIDDTDYISNDANKIFSLLKREKVNTVSICGLHLNMCLMKNTYGIINLVSYGFQIEVLSKLTDVMYNRKNAPNVSQKRAKEIMLDYIDENYGNIV